MRGVLCAAACLPVGFGVAVATGVRPVGGVVLVILAALAGRWSGAPVQRQAAWYALVALLFGLSHVLGHVIGTWPAIAVVTAAATFAYAARITGKALSERSEPLIEATGSERVPAGGVTHAKRGGASGDTNSK
jgi:hypothetical protein